MTPRSSFGSREAKTLRIVLDENLPKVLTKLFGAPHQSATTQQLGFAGWKNGALLAKLETRCDVFVTSDKSLRYQQNLSGRNLAIVELPTNRLKTLQTMTAEIVAAVLSAKPSSYIQVDWRTKP